MVVWTCKKCKSSNSAKRVRCAKRAKSVKRAKCAKHATNANQLISESVRKTLLRTETAD